MLISIITVTYNASETVAKTMQSVASQSFSLYEHIIIDGASTDETLEIVKKHSTPRTLVFSEPDKGLYDAMNKGLDRAKGEYVIFLNAGDAFASTDTLSRVADAAKRDNTDTPDIIYGQTELVDASGNVIGPRHLIAPDNLDFNSFKKGMLVCHQAFMVKRSIAPHYNTHYRFSADYEWCLRCLKIARRNVYLGCDPVIHYLNEGMTTRNHKASLKERFKIMCKYYGTLPTIFRHIGFAFRQLKRL